MKNFISTFIFCFLFTNYAPAFSANNMIALKSNIMLQDTDVLEDLKQEIAEIITAMDSEIFKIGPKLQLSKLKKLEQEAEQRIEDARMQAIIRMYAQQDSDSRYKIFEFKESSKSGGLTLTKTFGFFLVIILILLALIVPAMALPVHKTQDNQNSRGNFVSPYNVTLPQQFRTLQNIEPFAVANLQTTGLSRSYPLCSDLRQYAFTYDQGLVLNEFIRRQDITNARKVVQTLKGLQKHSSGLYYSGYNPETKAVSEWNIHTGFNAWLGFSYLNYSEYSGEKIYLDFARSIADALLERQDSNGGFFGDQSRTWKSTEHNIDTVVLYYRLWKITGESKYETAFRDVLEWIKTKAWNDSTHRFNRGENDPSFASDTTSFGILGLLGNEEVKILLPDIDVLLMMDYTDLMTLKSVVFQYKDVRGYDFADPAFAGRANNPMVSGEWTAQMCLSLAQEGLVRVYDKIECLSQIARLQNEGGIVYATKANLATGHGWNTPCIGPSIAGTIWYEWAMEGYNPFYGIKIEDQYVAGFVKSGKYAGFGILKLNIEDDVLEIIMVKDGEKFIVYGKDDEYVENVTHIKRQDKYSLADVLEEVRLYEELGELRFLANVWDKTKDRPIAGKRGDMIDYDSGLKVGEIERFYNKKDKLWKDEIYDLDGRLIRTIYYDDPDVPSLASSSEVSNSVLLATIITILTILGFDTSIDDTKNIQMQKKIKFAV